MMFLVVCADVFCVQSFCARKLIVYLNCSALPLAAECVDECELKFRSVECAFAGLDFVLKSCCVACVAQCFFCVLPCCEIADVVFHRILSPWHCETSMLIYIMRSYSLWFCGYAFRKSWIVTGKRLLFSVCVYGF